MKQVIRYICITIIMASAVVPRLCAESAGTVRLITELEDSTVYVGLPLEYVVRLQIGPQFVIEDYEALQPEIEIEGCEVNYALNVPESMREEEDIEGRRWVSVVIDRLFITPDAAGKYCIPSLKYNVQGMEYLPLHDTYPGLWGGNMPYTPMEYSLSSDPVCFEAYPMPKDAPEEFNGIVGEFSANARCSVTEAAVDDLITVVYTITGTGNLSDIDLPDLSAADLSLKCEIGEPLRACREQKAGSRMMGVVRYTYSIRPQQSGTLKISLPRLTYLDPEKGQYATVGADPVTICIKPRSTKNR